MRTFSDLGTAASGMPPQPVSELARVERGRGREELHLRQAPQVVERLAAQTRYQSITASNAIEGVVVDPERALDLIQKPTSTLRDRTEREFAGYRDAVDYLMGKEPEALSLPLILHLHRQLKRHVEDPLAGQFKVEDNFIGDRDGEGRVTVVFKTVPAGGQTEWHSQELVDRYEDALRSSTVHPLVLVGALVLDFLAIHPFRDGNGRLARLITSHELLRHGYGIARYISLEQRIYEARNSYYQALRASQADWHEANHNLWPWAGFLLRLLADAYAEFERRVIAQRHLAGATKAEQAREYVLHQAPTRFRSSDIVAALPDISPGTIRNALNALRDEGILVATRGRSAVWSRVEPGVTRD